MMPRLGADHIGVAQGLSGRCGRDGVDGEPAVEKLSKSGHRFRQQVVRFSLGGMRLALALWHDIILVDEDGIYDPRPPKDRLLLGMRAR
jgi:hypothetical protein